MTPLTDYLPVKHSETVLAELMIPSYANFGGKIHGGLILSLMDKVAYVCATKHASAYCVTASIDTVDFRQPVEVGELVTLMASVNYVGSSSMVVGIRVISENVKNHTVKHTNTSYFTMVAIDEDHKPLKVPGLILENEEQLRRFVEGKRRKELKMQHKEIVKQVLTSVQCEADKILLTNERCKISF
jgi:uncharacterized protein (TIGR00369 family)